MAEAAIAMKDKPKAMQYFEKALEKSADDSTVALLVIDRMYDALGQEDSTAWCKQRLQKDPKDIIANVAMYNVCLREGDIDDALKYGDVVASLSGPKTDAGLAYRINNTDILMRVYIHTNDVKYQVEALKALEALLVDLEGRPAMLSKVWNNLAYMLAVSGTRLDEALDYVRKAYETAPFDGNILDTYAYVLYRKGDYKEARERIRSAISLYEKTSKAAPSDVYERLAQIAEKLGETQEALAAYRRAVEVGGQLTPAKTSELNAAIERLAAENK
jgi:tetratricopeptide (TPR) repeat protein